MFRDLGGEEMECNSDNSQNDLPITSTQVSQFKTPRVSLTKIDFFVSATVQVRFDHFGFSCKSDYPQ